MSDITILVVEDNPITRQLYRDTLEREGMAVVEAADGTAALEHLREKLPSLVLQDVVLPDMNGFELLAAIRALPGGAELPVLGVSGFSERIDPVHASIDFDEFLIKPVERAELLRATRAHLHLDQAGWNRVGGSKTVLVVEDNPVQLKLMTLQLKAAGFRTMTATGGEDAIRVMAKQAPDAVLSDVLMSGGDGFDLCLAIRRDPLLNRVPVILISSCYVDELDRDLGKRVGANALVTRQGSLDNAITALLETLRHPSALAPSPVEPQAALAHAHLQRVSRELERQLHRSSGLAQRCAIQGVALSALGTISSALANNLAAGVQIQEILAQCLDAAGLSRGALYLEDATVLGESFAQVGYAELGAAEAKKFFGHPELQARVVASGAPESVPSATPVPEAEADFLARAGRVSALIIPIVLHAERLGTLLLLSARADLVKDEWASFARTLGTQLAQTFVLARSVRRLAASEQRYRGLVERASEAILVLDGEGTVLEANRQAEELIARPRADIVGQPCLSFVAEESRPAASEVFGRMLQDTRSVAADIHIRRPSGEVRYVDFSASTFEESGQRILLAIGLDLTKKRADDLALKESQEKLRQSQKMEAVGLLAGGVAHDFNNILTVISGHAQFIIEERDCPEQIKKDAQVVNQSAGRAAALTRQLLAFSRKQVLQPKVLALNAVVVELQRMLQRLLGAHIVLESELAENLGSILADPGQMEQLLMNLLVNASDAMPQGGTVTVRTANAIPDAALLASHPVLTPVPHAMLSVVDTGHGMDAKTKARIFEPFFTTKEKGKGTGIGLATVFGIVEQSKGCIVVDSAPGKGTRFDVYFPLVQEAVIPELLGVDGMFGKSERRATILIVEDDTAVRALGTRALAMAGHVVLEADGPAEAIRLLEAHRGTVDLVITDVVMPQMSGVTMAKQLTTGSPALKLLFMSGYNDEALAPHGTLPAGTPFLSKPFTPAALNEKVREVLARRVD